MKGGGGVQKQKRSNLGRKGVGGKKGLMEEEKRKSLALDLKPGFPTYRPVGHGF